MLNWKCSVGNEPIYRLITIFCASKRYCAETQDKSGGEERLEWKEVNTWRTFIDEENMRLNILTFKKKKEGFLTGVLLCVFAHADCCDQEYWEPVTLCCTVNACWETWRYSHVAPCHTNSVLWTARFNTTTKISTFRAVQPYSSNW